MSGGEFSVKFKNIYVDCDVEVWILVKGCCMLGIVIFVVRCWGSVFFC